MDKTKIIPIILLVVIMGIGFVAYSFYGEKIVLTAANEDLKQERSSLVEENNTLKYKYNSADTAKKDAEKRLSLIQQELTRVQMERKDLEKNLARVSQERDLLIGKVASVSKVQIRTVDRQSTGGGISEDHWADFVKEKASLEAKVEILNKVLFEEKTKISKMTKENTELSLKADELAKEAERLEDQIKFKERTLRIMSLDLVNEREERGAAVSELKKLRNENVNLKRELILVNKEQIKLQDVFKDTLDKKEGLQRKIEDAENILQQKATAFKELQFELTKTIEGGKRIIADESASVELPPIVVKPGAPGLKGLRGEVIAVNREEEFVVIDLGEASGLKPGDLLKIVRRDREIATVEVIETRKEISAANIKEIIGGLTIQEGDVAINR